MALLGEDRIESLQPQCHRPMTFTLQIDEWGIEIIPSVENAEDGHRGNDRIRLWQDYMPQDLKWPGAINTCRIIQFCRQGHEELTQKKNIPGICKKSRDDQRVKGIIPANFLEQNESRDEGYLWRQHNGGK